MLESGVHVGAAGRLRHQDHVAELELGQDELPAAVSLDRHELARGRAERADNLLAQGLGQGREPLQIVRFVDQGDAFEGGQFLEFPALALADVAPLVQHLGQQRVRV